LSLQTQVKEQQCPGLISVFFRVLVAKDTNPRSVGYRARKLFILPGDPGWHRRSWFGVPAMLEAGALE
jgi:hypothetical protein